jgi:hypothetical protein
LLTIPAGREQVFELKDLSAPLGNAGSERPSGNSTQRKANAGVARDASEQQAERGSDKRPTEGLGIGNGMASGIPAGIDGVEMELDDTAGPEHVRMQPFVPVGRKTQVFGLSDVDAAHGAVWCGQRRPRKVTVVDPDANDGQDGCVEGTLEVAQLGD